jgi:hypothetical protein
MTPSISEDAVMTALRSFLLEVLPAGVEVIQGQQNRAPEPRGPNHIVMTPARREQLSSTTHGYDPASNSNTVARSTAFHCTLDIYGPDGSDNAQVVSTLLRDSYGCEFLEPYGIQPLYCDDGQQMPLVNGEFQYENRWMVRCVLQANPSVVVSAEFGDSVITTLTRAD